MSVFDPDYDEPDSDEELVEWEKFGGGVHDTWLHVNDANKNGETELTRAARLGLTARVTRLLAAGLRLSGDGLGIVRIAPPPPLAEPLGLRIGRFAPPLLLPEPGGLALPLLAGGVGVGGR